jgi:predicted dehydrogenase
MNSLNRLSRRSFLKATAVGGAALSAAPAWGRVLGSNDRINVGLIGIGARGSDHLDLLLKHREIKPDIEIVALCDVYQKRLNLAASKAPGAKTYVHHQEVLQRKDLDVVFVVTPDHWHAPITLAAMESGKDVYVEKPMTLFLDEGKWMIQAARKSNRIVTVGTQRRHGKGVAAARKVVEAGTLGKIHSVRMASFRNIYPGFGKTPVSDPPSGLDYDMWLGPAPKKPYTAHRGIYHFRWFWDYSGGQMTNLGAHIIDQVLWIMNVKGPTTVTSTGGRYALEDDGETPDLQDASWVFPTFTMNCAIREANASRGDPGQVYLGTKGTMTMAGGYQVTPEQKIDPINDIPRFQGHPMGGPVYSDTKPSPWIEPQSGGVSSDARYGTGGEDTLAMNERDWLDSMRSRKRPLCEVEDGHRVSIACHLANMSLRLGRSIRWDPEKEQVIGDKEAAAMCVRPYRAPWDAALRSLVKV